LAIIPTRAPAPLPALRCGAAAEALRRQADLEPASLFDADSLGGNRLAFAFGAGFPYVQAAVGLNLLEGLDADLNLDSLYGVATQLSLGPKLRLAHAGGLALAAEVQGQWAVFRTSAAAEKTGARYLTGLRNFGVQPQLVVSYRGHYGSIFASAIYQGTFDLEPQSSGPLQGDPGAWTYGSNLGFHLGGELAPSGVVHAYGVVGLDFHLRQADFPVLPVVELGFTFPS